MTATAHPATDTALRALGLRTLGRGATGLLKALTTPLLPDDAVTLVNPLLSADLHGRITSIIRATPNAAHIRIRPGRRWKGHRPGQYVRIGLDVDGVRTWRAYSLTGLPGERDLEITVKQIPGGVASHHLLHEARVGDVILLDQATGEFTRDVLPRHDQPVLFLTAGSGITPVAAMLRSHVDEFCDPVLVHSAPTADEVVFGPELRALHGAGRLRLVERHTDVDGWFTPGQLDSSVPDWRERHAFACGPTAMLDALQEHYEAAGLADLLHTERFRARLAATGEGGEVTFAATGLTVSADGATPLLDAGEAAGVLMPSGCRMGICYGCSSTLLEGSVRDLRTGAVTTVDPVQDPAGQKIQTCVSAAAGACHLDR